MGAVASQISSLTIVYYSGVDQRKHQSSASLVFVRGIHRWPVSSPHTGPVMRKVFPLDDVILWTVIKILLCDWNQYATFSLEGIIWGNKDLQLLPVSSRGQWVIWRWQAFVGLVNNKCKYVDTSMPIAHRLACQVRVAGCLSSPRKI